VRELGAHAEVRERGREPLFCHIFNMCESSPLAGGQIADNRWSDTGTGRETDTVRAQERERERETERERDAGSSPAQ
jgi:hypothetical protein